MIPYFRSNISAKNYRNRIVHFKIIASRRWDVFLRRGVVMGGWGLPNVTDYLTYDFLLVFHGNLVTLLLRIVSENSQQIGRKSHILGDRL